MVLENGHMLPLDAVEDAVRMGVETGGWTVSMRFESFIRGSGTVLDLWPAPRRSHIGVGVLDHTDAEALHSDWVQVGRDLSAALSQYAKSSESL